ncbi:probable Iron sulfur cluster assembly protein 1, mitochondrial [Zygosaccharomyces bailii]|nr:probable Iron sulfur cluster assembly protein 1, mitochondrial [Zygosaccharomyces bailii]
MLRLGITRGLTRASFNAPRITTPVLAQGVRLYHPKVIDHYTNPRNVGSMDKNLKTVGTGLVGAPACGDVMKLQIQVGDDGTIEDVKFKTFGCGSAIASSSYMTELVRGKSLEEAAKIRNTQIAKELSLPPVKLHCSMLAEDAIKAAIKDYQSKRSKGTVLTGGAKNKEAEVTA